MDQAFSNWIRRLASSWQIIVECTSFSRQIHLSICCLGPCDSKHQMQYALPCNQKAARWFPTDVAMGCSCLAKCCNTMGRHRRACNSTSQGRRVIISSTNMCSKVPLCLSAARDNLKVGGDGLYVPYQTTKPNHEQATKTKSKHVIHVNQTTKPNPIDSQRCGRCRRKWLW